MLEVNNCAGKLPLASIPPEIQSRDVPVSCPFTRFAIPPTDRSLAMLLSLARSAYEFRTTLACVAGAKRLRGWEREKRANALPPQNSDTLKARRKKSLAIVEAFNKFDQWLLGKSNIIVHIDHQPLQSIFPKDLTSSQKRLQKMLFITALQLHCDVQKKLGKVLHYIYRIPCQGPHART